jgi:hypothetical protein
MVEKWSSINILHMEIGSHELELVEPIFYVQFEVRIMSIHTEQFQNKIIKFEFLIYKSLML